MLTLICSGSPWAPSLTLGKGGKAGIWQSGMGIAADIPNNRVFFATGYVFRTSSPILVSFSQTTVTQMLRVI
jgi:hypothetical protein